LSERLKLIRNENGKLSHDALNEFAQRVKIAECQNSNEQVKVPAVGEVFSN
jgi:hypothetical protein